jgi:hypothetical protein
MDMTQRALILESTDGTRTAWETTDYLITVCVILAAGTLALDLALPSGMAISTLYAAVVLVSLCSSQRQFTTLASSVSSLLTILGFLLSPADGDQWMALVNRSLALGVIWGTTIVSFRQRDLEAKREQMMHEREETLASDKILHGLLPICASCKDVRDDRGRWHQIEGYISGHSEAEFTHSICPDCMKKLSEAEFTHSICPDCMKKLYPEYVGHRAIEASCTH